MIAEARRFGGLLLFAAAVLALAYQRPSDIFVSFGPNDAPYIEGFRGDFEIDEPTFIHWSSTRSAIRLPFHLNGAFDVTLRYKRHIASPATVRWYLAGELVETVEVPQGDFTLRDFHADNTSGGPFEMRLLSRSADPRPLGIALDWLQVRPARKLGAVIPTLGVIIAVLSWVAAFYLVPRLIGLGTTVSLTSGALAAVTLSVLAFVNKLWPLHASAVLGSRVHVMTALVVGFFWLRRRKPSSVFAAPSAKWAVYIAFAAFAVRLFALFHPDFYYPDIRTHSKFVYLIWSEGLGGLFQNYIESQHRHLLGLQLVGERWVAFPYPPILYLAIYPLSLLRLPVEDWMKIVPCALLGIESLVVYAVATRLGAGARASLVAVLLHSTARVLGFRLAVASYAALFGHFWDTLAVAYLVFFFDRMSEKRYLLGWAALIAVSLLSYAGSVLVLGMLVPSLCLAFVFVPKAERPVPARLWSVALSALAASLVSLAVFYGRYIPEILTHPSGSGTGELIEWSLTPVAALAMAAHRLNLFYSLFGLGALAGLLLLRRRLRERLGFAIATACLFTYVGLNFLRAGLGATHIFQFSKDDLVILPVIVVALGMLVSHGARSFAGSLFWATVIAGWIVWGGVRFSEDIRGRFFRPDYPPTRAIASGSSRPTEQPPGLPLAEAASNGYDAAHSTRLPPARLAR